MLVAISFILCPKAHRECAYCGQRIYEHCFRRFGVEVEGKGKNEVRSPWVIWQCAPCIEKQRQIAGESAAKMIAKADAQAQVKEARADNAFEQRFLREAAAQGADWARAQREKMIASGLDITEFVNQELCGTHGGAGDYHADADRLAKSLGYKSNAWDSESNRGRREKKRETARKRGNRAARQAALLAAQKDKSNG